LSGLFYLYAMATIIDLREKLAGKINKIERIDLLEYMLQLIENEEDSIPYVLSIEQQDAVNEALDQYEKGQYISDEEADKEISQWLNK
jgi:predicted transcriptional regulator